MLPGQRLKEIRSRLGIATRDVAEKSQRIAETEGNHEFYISNAWLTQIENTNATPSIYKLYSLSAVYHVKFTDLLLLFGVDLLGIAKHLPSILPENTQLTDVESGDADQSVSLPVRLRESFNQDHTNLVSRIVEIWGDVPLILLQKLDVKYGLYGYIGLRDYTLFPLIRPGAFVHIDPRLKKIRSLRWRNEFERPVYFVELRDGYACAWCELQGNKLLLVPHPLSPCSIRQFLYGTEAEVLGQVTGVAMRMAAAAHESSDGAEGPARLS